MKVLPTLERERPG